MRERRTPPQHLSSDESFFSLASSRRYVLYAWLRADDEEGAASDAAAACRSAGTRARAGLGGRASEGGFGGGSPRWMAGLVCFSRRADDAGQNGTRRAGRRPHHRPSWSCAESRGGGGAHGTAFPRRRSSGGWNYHEHAGTDYQYFRDAGYDPISIYAGLPWCIAGHMDGAGELEPAGFNAYLAGRRSLCQCVPRRSRAGPHGGSILGPGRAEHRLGSPAGWVDE